jgi:hypothetical protein
MLWSSTLPRESRYDARGGTRGGRRLPLREAAEVLGVSKDAVRQRVKRGTIRSDKGEDGRVYVYVDASSEATTDGVHSTGGAADELLERTEELITTLREQLQAERQAHAEARRLLAAALERIPPQLPAPEDASESPQPRPDRTADRRRQRRAGDGLTASVVAALAGGLAGAGATPLVAAAAACVVRVVGMDHAAA